MSNDLLVKTITTPAKDKRGHNHPTRRKYCFEIVVELEGRMEVLTGAWYGGTEKEIEQARELIKRANRIEWRIVE
jgi:hypothetical protein